MSVIIILMVILVIAMVFLFGLLDWLMKPKFEGDAVDRDSRSK